MSNFETLFAQLNPGQRQAVEALEGPVLVVAGPGTGKTQILAMRIANILSSTDTKPGNILCLTFTEAGVLAMRKRLQSIIGSAAFHVKVHTFHSFCNEVIQSFPEKFAFSRNLAQLDDLTRVKLMSKLLTAPELMPGLELEHLRPFHNNVQYQAEIISAIQTLKREGVSAEVFMQRVQAELTELESNPDINTKTNKPKQAWLEESKAAQKNLELAHLYQHYQQQLQQLGYYDYEDMILFVIEKLAADDELLGHYQEQFLYILVDEYQDTNGAQNEIIRLLGSFDASPNIFAVGDDDQAIYRFQGANVENLLQFTKQFENVQTIPIIVNHRSSQLILDLANSLIDHNQLRLTKLLPDLSKDLKAAFDIPDHPAEIYTVPDSDLENQLLIKKIQELTEADVDYSEIAVLYRRHRDADDTIQALLKADIPLQMVRGDNVLAEKIIQKLLTLLKVIQYEGEDRDLLLFEVLFYDFLNFPRLDVFKLTNFAHKERVSLFNVLSDLELLTKADVAEPQIFVDFTQRIIAWKALDANVGMTEFMEQVSQESGYLAHVFAGDFDLEDIDSVTSFFNYVRELTKQEKSVKLRELLQDIDLLNENKLTLKAKGLDMQKEGIFMSTAHGVKGLEFKHVFIIKFYDGNWGGFTRRQIIKLPTWVYGYNPHTQETAAEISPAAQHEVEDERRLLYVALTRAKENIYISTAEKYPSGNSFKEVTASQFLSEFKPSLIVKPDITKYLEADLEFKQQQLAPLVTSNYSAAEKAYLHNLVAKFKLSPTTLNTYLRCPLDFKFNCLINMPRVPTNQEILGQAVHYALEQYMYKLKAEEPVDKDFLLAMFNKAVYFEPVGPVRVAEIIKEGEGILSSYHDHYADSLTTPIATEYSFKNHNITLELPELEPVALTGKIDKFEWVDQVAGTIKITDYKTMTPKSVNEIKGATKSSDGHIWNQVVFYHLLADLDEEFRPHLGAAKYKVDCVEIDFLKPNSSGKFKRESLTVTTEDIANLKQTILEVMTKVRNLDFGSEKYPLCGECESCRMFNPNVI